jgi:hypothetical protein
MEGDQAVHSRKIVVALDAIVATGFQAALLESGGPSRT